MREKGTGTFCVRTLRKGASPHSFLQRSASGFLGFVCLFWLGATGGDRPHHHLIGSEHVVHDHLHLGFHEHEDAGHAHGESGGSEEGRADPWEPPADRDDPRKPARFLPGTAPMGESGVDDAGATPPERLPSIGTQTATVRRGGVPLALHRSPRAPPPVL
jgi:hypothetical protein